MVTKLVIFTLLIIFPFLLGGSEKPEMRGNNDELVSNVGIVAGSKAVEAYANTVGVSLEEARLQMGSKSTTAISLASQTVPNDHLIISNLVILEGQEAIQAYARDSGKSVSEVEALITAAQSATSNPLQSEVITPQAFCYYYGELACRTPETARVFFNAGRGTINLSFIGQFALQGGGTTDRANTYWNCTQDICSLYGFVQLIAPGDYTNNYEVFNLLNTINVITDDYGAGGVA